MLELFLKSFPAFGMGILITLEITVFALIFATIIGLVVGLINIGKNKILKAIAKIYIDLIRGTPLIIMEPVNRTLGKECKFTCFFV